MPHPGGISLVEWAVLVAASVWMYKELDALDDQIRRSPLWSAIVGRMFLCLAAMGLLVLWILVMFARYA